MLHAILIALGAVIVHLGAQTTMQKFGWLKPLGQKIEANAPAIEADIKKGAKFVEHMPEYAALKVELAHKESELRNTRVGLIAGKVLHSFNKQLSELTPDDITAASALIKTQANRAFGVDLSSGEIAGIIDDFQRGSDLVAATSLFQAYQQLAKEKQAVAQVEVSQSATAEPKTTEATA